MPCPSTLVSDAERSSGARQPLVCLARLDAELFYQRGAVSVVALYALAGFGRSRLVGGAAVALEHRPALV